MIILILAINITIHTRAIADITLRHIAINTAGTMYTSTTIHRSISINTELHISIHRLLFWVDKSVPLTQFLLWLPCMTFIHVMVVLGGAWNEDAATVFARQGCFWSLFVAIRCGALLLKTMKKRTKNPCIARKMSEGCGLWWILIEIILNEMINFWSLWEINAN